MISCLLALATLLLMATEMRASKAHAAAQSFAPTRACNQEFGRISKDEINAIADVFINVLTTSSAVASLAKNNLLNTVDYDVLLIKVCGSCANISAERLGGNETFYDDSPFGFATYCQNSSYGFNAVHSALVLAPINPITNQIVVGRIRGLLSVRLCCSSLLC